jgi:rhodanese-related sulfurtransferase
MRLVVMLVILVLMMAVDATAEVVKPHEINAHAVKFMMEDDQALVIFPLSSIEFNDLHIKGSINIQISQLDSKLPKDKSRRLIFYCLGLKCLASMRAAEKAVELGYQNVYAFREGLPGWLEAGYPTVTIEKIPMLNVDMISTSALALLLNAEEFTLVDINPDEVGHNYYIDYPRRVHIPLDEMPMKMHQLDKNRPIVVSCFKGYRAVLASRYLISKGLEKVFALEGGMQKWVLEGRPYSQYN